jgi:hypothetical protein
MQVAHLFAAHDDLLEEFTFFLPDSKAPHRQAMERQRREREQRLAADAHTRRNAATGEVRAALCSTALCCQFTLPTLLCEDERMLSHLRSASYPATNCNARRYALLPMGGQVKCLGLWSAGTAPQRARTVLHTIARAYNTRFVDVCEAPALSEVRSRGRYT